MRATFVDNLQVRRARSSRAAGIKLLIEPINTYDIPGFYLNRTQQALDILRDVGSDNLYIQYDIYHMQRMEGELANTIKANLPKIAHLQLADNPGRNEPGTGEINYRFLFGFLDAIGYDGWIGCEYKPKGNDGRRPRLARRARRERVDHRTKEQSSMANVGFIGLGIMGAPMAGHLIKGGHRVYLHSRSGVPPALTEAGGIACAAREEVAQKADVIITMVPDTPHVEAALFGDDGVAQGAVARARPSST